MREHMLLLSSGHGGSDPGAEGYGINERDYCLQFRDRVSWVLQNCFECQEKLSVLLVPNGINGTSDVNTAVEYVNRKFRRGVNTLAIDYHLNAFKDESAKGWEILAYPGDSMVVAETYARLLKPTYIKVNIPFRGIKDGSWTGFIGRTEPIAFIMELAFVSNDNEAKLLKNRWGASEVLVFGHAKALVDVLGVKYSIKSQFLNMF